MSSILLTGVRAPVTLEFCRAFARYGYRVFLADMPVFPLARWSKYAEHYARLPAPTQHLEAFQVSLQDLIERHKIEHLIPTCEEAFYVSKIKAQLPCKVWTSEFDLMVQLHHKQHFLDLAKGFFLVPATVVCSAFQDWKNARNYVFKPIFSRFGSKVIIGQEENQCREPQQNPHDWIAQERLVGQEICVYSIWRQGKLGGFAAYYPKHKVGKGASMYFEPFFEQSVFDAVLKFGEYHQCDGQLSFDIMLCKDGVYVLECNPRSTSGAHLIGADLPQCFFSDQPVIHRSSQAKAIKAAWLLTQPGQVFSRDNRLALDVIWDAKDLNPFLLQGLSVIELAYLAVRHRKNILAVSTRDIEFNG